jgi:hypothetical protein
MAYYRGGSLFSAEKTNEHDISILNGAIQPTLQPRDGFYTYSSFFDRWRRPI